MLRSNGISGSLFRNTLRLCILSTVVCLLSSIQRLNMEVTSPDILQCCRFFKTFFFLVSFVACCLQGHVIRSDFRHVGVMEIPCFFFINRIHTCSINRIHAQEDWKKRSFNIYTAITWSLCCVRFETSSLASCN